MSALSTRVITSTGAEAKALVGFHMKPGLEAEESAVRGAGCKIETMDADNAQVALSADMHFFYPVRHLCPACDCSSS